MLQRFIQKGVIPTGNKKASFLCLGLGQALVYCQYGRIVLNGNTGTFYKLCGKGYPYHFPLSEQEQNEYCQKYNNVTFFKGGAQYAPEMNFLYLFIADKAIKAEGVMA